MIRVLLKTDNRLFSEKLAYRLSEMTDRMKIDLEGTEEDYDVVIDDSCEKEILPVSALLRQIITAYTEKTGNPFYERENGLKRVFRFSSRFGGSGLSSVAFSFARILCGKTGQRTLFVDYGPEGRFIAGEYISLPEGSVRELEYMVREKRLGDPFRYLSEDHYGPFVICIERNDPESIMRVAEKGGFRQIVICGNAEEELMPGEEVRIAVVNMKDIRYADLNGVPEGYDYLVKNRDYINSVSGNTVAIADDAVSFKLIDKNVRISMSGDFGIGVDKLVRMVTEDDEKGIIWKMS